LTDAEFRMLHEADAASPPPAHHHLRVDDLTAREQTRLIDSSWDTQNAN